MGRSVAALEMSADALGQGRCTRLYMRPVLASGSAQETVMERVEQILERVNAAAELEIIRYAA